MAVELVATDVPLDTLVSAFAPEYSNDATPSRPLAKE
jgi:hypothetical protein